MPGSTANDRVPVHQAMAALERLWRDYADWTAQASAEPEGSRNREMYERQAIRALMRFRGAEAMAHLLLVQSPRMNGGAFARFVAQAKARAEQSIRANT